MINLTHHFMNGKKLYENLLAPVANKYNLTMMELNILMFLANHPMYDTAKDIIKYRHFVKSHVSSSLKTLLDKDLISTFADEKDKRTIHIKLDKKTDEIVANGRKAQKKYMNYITDGFSSEDIDKLNDLFKRIDANIAKFLK